VAHLPDVTDSHFRVYLLPPGVKHEEKHLPLGLWSAHGMRDFLSIFFKRLELEPDVLGRIKHVHGSIWLSLAVKLRVLRLSDAAQDDYPVISLEGEAEGVAEAQGELDLKLAPCVALDAVSLDGV